MSQHEHHYYVYLVASRTRVLYCGMTNNMQRRAAAHKTGAHSGFTTDFRCQRLVWFEHFQYVLNAIEREKQIKGWTRKKKIALIEKTNSSWADLSEGWTEKTADPSTALGMTKGGAVVDHKGRLPDKV